MTSSIWLRSERSDSPWLIHHTLSAVDAGPARKCVLGFAVFVTLLTATSIHLDANDVASTLCVLRDVATEMNGINYVSRPARAH